MSSRSKRRSRGAVSKATSRGVLIYFPLETFPAIDDAVRLCDTDRSKFIRSAVREKLQRVGVSAFQPIAQ